jgi:hypothetical protein
MLEKEYPENLSTIHDCMAIGCDAKAKVVLDIDLKDNLVITIHVCQSCAHNFE